MSFRSPPAIEQEKLHHRPPKMMPQARPGLKSWRAILRSDARAKRNPNAASQSLNALEQRHKMNAPAMQNQKAISRGVKFSTQQKTATQLTLARRKNQNPHRVMGPLTRSASFPNCRTLRMTLKFAFMVTHRSLCRNATTAATAMSLPTGF